MKSIVIRFSLIILGLIALTGCAQKNVQLSEEFWATKNQKILVAKFKARTPEVYFVSNQSGLLQAAVMGLHNRTLNAHLKHADLNWYQALPNDFSHQLKSRHFHVKID